MAAAGMRDGGDGGFVRSFKKLMSRSSVVVPEGYQPISPWQSLKHLLAVFVDDLEPQKEYHASTPRHFGRMAVTLATVVAFVAIAVFLFTSAVPSSRTVRNWATHPSQPNHMKIFNFSNSDAKTFRNDTSQICFCRKTNINWPDYVAFFPITNVAASGNGSNTNVLPVLQRGDNITDWGSFCHSTILGESSLAGNACLIMVEAVVAPNISQTCLESASLIGPSLLNDTINSRVRGGLDQIFWNYKILISLQNTQHDYDLVLKLYSLWTTMLDQFYSNHMSSYQDYWEAAKNNNVLDVITGNQTALGMEVFWYKYANICNPPFCDVVVQNSWQYRAFLVIAQVGGISTLGLLFIRIFLWPSLRLLFGWPSLFPLHENIQMNHPKDHNKLSGKVEPLQESMSSADNPYMTH